MPVTGGEILPARQRTGEAVANKGTSLQAVVEQVEQPQVIMPTPTGNPYEGLTIENLAARPYGGGSLEILKTMADEGAFIRYLIRYPSDGLSIYGFMNVPKSGQAPFPVIIALHGYVDPQRYQTLDYTTIYADILARAGYLVIHPNLRGYPPSEDGLNLFRVGMAVDVLNLVALIKDQGGLPGPLEAARNDAIGLWGHSMGGGIALRVATSNPEIRAVFLYSAMSGDEWTNYSEIFKRSGGTSGYDELLVPQEDQQRISPINYLANIQAAISIHHGEDDQQVPLQWSVDLCQRLQDLGKQVDCYTYPGQPHSFNAADGDLLMNRAIEFFDRQLMALPASP